MHILNNGYVVYEVLRCESIVLWMYCLINEFKEKELFYSEKGRQFPDEFVFFFQFLFSN